MSLTIHDIEEFDILDFGNRIQLSGALYSGMGKVLVIPFPEEDVGDLDSRHRPVDVLDLTTAEWERVLQQSDVLDIRVLNKAILRKSQRHIDNVIAWNVYRRDGYACRYCGRNAVPLTVDHVILWEDGGATVEDNLVAACRRCNRERGSTPYDRWIESPQYRVLSASLDEHVKGMNLQLVLELPRLALLKAKPRSR